MRILKQLILSEFPDNEMNNTVSYRCDSLEEKRRDSSSSSPGQDPRCMNLMLSAKTKITLLSDDVTNQN